MLFLFIKNTYLLSKSCKVQKKQLQAQLFYNPPPPPLRTMVSMLECLPPQPPESRIFANLIFIYY